MPKGYAHCSSGKGGGAPLQPGAGYEGFFKGEWHPVEVLKVMNDTVQVKWAFDGSDSEVWKDYVRQAASKPSESSSTAVQPGSETTPQSNSTSEEKKPWKTDAVANDQKTWGSKGAEQKSWSANDRRETGNAKPQRNDQAAANLQPGTGYEAFCQGEYYGVEVIKVAKDSVTVKWDFDGVVAEIYPHYVRQAANKPNASSSTALQPGNETTPQSNSTSEEKKQWKTDAVASDQKTWGSKAAGQKSWSAHDRRDTGNSKPQRNDQAAANLQPGTGYEAFCQGEYYSVEVVKVTKDSVTVKWDFDGVEAEIYPHYVRQAAKKTEEAAKKVEETPPAASQPRSEHNPTTSASTYSGDVRKQWNIEQKSWGANERKDASASKPAIQRHSNEQSSTKNAPLQPGTGYEAFCQGEYHGVEVIKVTKDSVTVKWDFDGVVAEIYPHYVRQAANASKVEATADTSDAWGSATKNVPKAQAAVEPSRALTSDPWGKYKADDKRTAHAADVEQKANGVTKEAEQHWSTEAYDNSLAAVSVRLQRKNGAIVPDHCHVKGLPNSITEEQLRSFFGKVGDVKWCKFLPRMRGEDTTAVLVQMSSAEEAQAAVARLNGTDPSECAATASIQSTEEPDEPSKQVMDAAVAKKVLRWLPKDAPKDVRSYFASLAESPVSSFGGC